MSVTVYNCPFCGHVAIEIDEVEMSEFSVTCPECRCTGPIKRAVMDAIVKWNKAMRKDMEQ